MHRPLMKLAYPHLLLLLLNWILKSNDYVEIITRWSITNKRPFIPWLRNDTQEQADESIWSISNKFQLDSLLVVLIQAAHISAYITRR